MSWKITIALCLLAFTLFAFTKTGFGATICSKVNGVVICSGSGGVTTCIKVGSQVICH